MKAEYVDVLIVGAGLSGIGAACHSCRRLPAEGLIRHPRRACSHRRHVGLVPLPGDSLGLGHVHDGLCVSPLDQSQVHRRTARPFRDYIRDTARGAGLERRFSFNHKVTRARHGRRRTRAGRSRPCAATARASRPCASAAGSYSCAAATTATAQASRRSSRGPSASRGASCIRRLGRKTSTTRTSAWW